jgi:hypothetical protein|tara:strand:+ start:850 stop:1122 length:273 start_codon:yes stop_codon:yes gene_type:complete
MTTIRLNNDYDRGNFQIKMALMYLASEVKSGMIMCHPSKGTTVRTLARYFPGLKKTRKGAYKQLLEAGVYAHDGVFNTLIDKKNGVSNDK